MRLRILFSILFIALFTGCGHAAAPFAAPGADAEKAPSAGLAAEGEPASASPAAVSFAVPAATPAPTPTATPVPDTVSLSLRFVGDLMCCNYQILGAAKPDGTYDFLPPFALVADDLSGADLLLGNFETNLVPGEPICGEMDGFNAPVEYLDAMKELGFDVLFTANKHALDFGVAGAHTTLAAIRAQGVAAVGTNAAPEDVDKIHIETVNGLSVAILAYADRTNKKTVELDGEEAYWAFNYFTEERLQKDVALARAQGAELIVMYLHEGREKLTKPNKYQLRDANWAFDAGVDLVIMSHTHSLLTMEQRQIETENGTKQVFCAYGLGNFMSSSIHEESLNNIILNLDLTYDRRLAGLSSLEAEYLLTRTVNYYDENDVWQFVIVPMERALNDFSIVDGRARLSERRLLRAYTLMRERMDEWNAAASVADFH